MKYLIAGNVIYDSDVGSLTIKEGERATRNWLTNTANKILSLLILMPDEVLTRGFILEQILDDAGSRLSVSSLNQYIGALKQALTTLTQIDEPIITVSNVGFYFNSDIKVELYTAVVADTAPGAWSVAVRSDRKNNKLYCLLLAMGLLLLLINAFLIPAEIFQHVMVFFS